MLEKLKRQDRGPARRRRKRQDRGPAQKEEERVHEEDSLHHH